MKNQELAESFAAMMAEATRNSPPRIDQLRGKDLFLRYVDIHTSIRAKEKAIDQAGLDVGNFVDDYYGMAKCMMCLYFNPAQVETIEWWLYEDVDKVISWPAEGREWRLETAEQLWDYLQTANEPK